jgi:hypothetical protein
MDLNKIKNKTTWNDAASSLNDNFAKLKQAIALGSLGTSAVMLDTEMSDESENVVQNKVIKKYVDDEIVTLEGYAEEVANAAEESAKRYTDEKISQGGGGSIDPELLEGYMPLSRDFSDDFNNDFTR